MIADYLESYKRVEIDAMELSQSYRTSVGIRLDRRIAVELLIAECEEAARKKIMKAIFYRLPVNTISEDFSDDYYHTLINHCKIHDVQLSELQFFTAEEVATALELATKNGTCIIDYLYEE